MRKVPLLFLLTLIFIGCSKKDTTYQVNNLTSFSMYDVIVFEYFEDDMVEQQNLGNMSSGRLSDVITAKDNTEKVKISMRLLPNSDRYYAVQKFYLDKEENTIITINDETMISSNPNSKHSHPIYKIIK